MGLDHHVVERLEVGVYRVPTEEPESDATLEWRSTTMVTVEACAAGTCGLGYTYADAAAATLIDGMLAPVVAGADAMAVSAAWRAMHRVARNQGTPGIVAAAISAVDAALWDLKARLLDMPLAVLLGVAREAVPVYGSGGFTSLSVDGLQRQLRGWIDAGIPRVKMKVGRQPEHDVERVSAAREAIGPDAELFVDANGGYARKQALRMAEAYARQGVTWLEEPVPSEDLSGLRLLRDRAPAGMAIAAGEYGYDHFYFRRMLEAGAVDVLQADGTRCAGITGLLHADALCQAHSMPLSLHTAPALHRHPGLALPSLIHVEYFHDHARLEAALLDGADAPRDGALALDRRRPGNGLSLRRKEALRYAI